MTKQERADLMKMLTLLLKSYPSSKADMQTLALYVEALDDLAYPAVRAGIVKTMHTARFFPTVAEIREATDSMSKHVNHDGLPDAGEAWGECMRWLQRNSPYDANRTPWKHPEVERAAKRFGVMSLYELEAEREAVSVQTLTDRGEAQESTRILLPWPGEQPEGASCQDIQVRLVRPTLRREGEDLNLDQEVAVSALCVGETETFGLEKTETISHRLPAGEGELCLWSAELTRVPSSQTMPEGLEVTVPLTFRWLRLEEGTCPVIRRVTLGEKRQVGEDTPSLIIRAVRGEQTLWDIAKANGAAQEDIMAASGLTDPELYSGQMLLIPRSAG